MGGRAAAGEAGARLGSGGSRWWMRCMVRVGGAEEAKAVVDGRERGEIGESSGGSSSRAAGRWQQQEWKSQQAKTQEAFAERHVGSHLSAAAVS